VVVMKVRSLRPTALLQRAQQTLSLKMPTSKQKRHALVGPPHVWKDKRRFQIEFLCSHGLRSEVHLVDIGCGTLRGGVPIIERLDAGHYVGVDVRPEIEAEAQAELRQHNLERKNPKLIFGRPLPEIRLDERFDIAWAFAVLFHLTDEHLDECFAFVQEHLAVSGAFFANVNLGTHAPNQWREFPELWRPLAQYEETAARFGLSVEDLGTLMDLGDRSTVGGSQHMLRFTRI
jgi:SAM-dependent methyltransferase